MQYLPLCSMHWFLLKTSFCIFSLAHTCITVWEVGLLIWFIESQYSAQTVIEECRIGTVLLFLGLPCLVDNAIFFLLATIQRLNHANIRASGASWLLVPHSLSPPSMSKPYKETSGERPMCYIIAWLLVSLPVSTQCARSLLPTFLITSYFAYTSVEFVEN